MLTFCKYAAFAALAMLCEQARSENTVHFESLSPEFDRLVGPTPSYEYLATGEAKELGAHEGAVFLEHGSQSLLGEVVVLFNGVGELVGRSGEDLQFQAGTRRLQGQFKAAS